MTVLPVDKLEPSIRRVATMAAALSAAMAGAFCVTVAAMLLHVFILEQRQNPLDNPEIASLKKELARNPKSEAIAKNIRAVDLQIREAYFQRRSFVTDGAWMLVGGGIVLLLSLKLFKELKTEPYLPQPADQKAVARASVAARRAVSFTGAILAGSLVAIAVLPRPMTFPKIENVPGVNPGAQIPAGPAFTAEQWAANWPVFRGPRGDATVASATPVEWDGASGKNIVWKAEVPLAGFNSPVVWGENVFISGANENQREVFCFSAADGKLKWRTPVGKGGKVEVNEGTGWAASTLATDGQRVYAIFPTGDLAALDLGGSVVWEKSLGVPENNYGHASSLAIWRDRLIVQYDQGSSPSPTKSALIAFACVSGEQVWKVNRPVAASWASPIVIEHNGKPQIITVASPLVISHNPENGEILWRAKVISGEIAPSPIFANGVVYTCQDRADLAATKVDGSGDVTKSHVVWKFSDNLPDTVSPIFHGGLVYVVTSSGTVTAVDASKGEEVWSQAIDNASFYASPFILGDRLYFPDRKGVTHMLAAGREYKKLGECKLSAEICASPAYAGGRLYLRTHQAGKDAPGVETLYCIGSK